MNLSGNIFVALMLFSVFLAPAFAQDATEEPWTDQRTVLDVSIDLTRKPGEQLYRGVLDLGTIPVNQELMLNLTMKNNSDQQIQFSGVSKKCSCNAFKAKSLVIPANGETKAEFKLKAPARKKSSRSGNSVTLEYLSQSVIKMEFEYELSGLLAFEEFLGTIRFKNDEQKKTIDVPLLMTAPVTLDQVSASASENLGKPKFEFVSTQDGPTLKVTVDEAILRGSDVRGELFIHSGESDKQDCYYLIVKNERTIEISPKMISFYKAEGKLISSAVIRLPTEMKNEGNETIGVTCSISGVNLGTEVTRLSERLIKVDLEMPNLRELPNGKTSDGDLEYLDWVIDINGSITKPNTPFIVNMKK
ncbi:MAG: hypothetical protein AAGA30_11525 [Planctomycetota bacterium]